MAEATRPKSRHLYWHIERCTTCQSCMTVCAERHTGSSAPLRARIRITVPTLGGDSGAEYCRQCRDARCAAACPVTAIRFDDELRAWLVDGDTCTGCGECVEACRFHAIRLDPGSGLAIKCDLCGGRVYCVQVCQAGALELRGEEG